MITYEQTVEMEGDFGNLHNRMNRDRDLYLLKKFVLLDWNTDKPLRYACNVTFNDARIFGDKIINLLIGSEMQTVIAGKELHLMPDKKTTVIESFLDKALYPAADIRLANRGVATLKSFHSDISCNRGRIATRCLVRTDKNGFVPDLLPMDTRFLVYERNSDGLMWHCYTMDRSKARIKSEYGKDVSAKTVEVRDVWDDDSNYVYVDKELAKNEKHKLGYDPAVIHEAPTGSAMQDKDSLEFTGESIYALARGLFEEKNKLGSILQTLNMMTFRGALQYMSKGGVLAPGPEEDPRAVGGMVSVEIDGGFKLVPVNDIQEAAKLFYAVVDAAIQRGTLPAIDYGNLNFPLSGSAISLLTSAKDPIFLPRLQLLGVHYRDLSKMAIKQYIDKKLVLELGDDLEKYIYTPEELKGDWDISYKFFAKAPEDEIANLQTAMMAVEFLPMEDILRDNLKLRDPQGTHRKKISEMAEMTNPVLATYRQGRSLAQEAEDEPNEERKRGLGIEAEIQYKKLAQMVQQIEAGAMQASTPALEKGKRAQTPLPMTGQGMSGQGRPPQGASQ